MWEDEIWKVKNGMFPYLNFILKTTVNEELYLLKIYMITFMFFTYNLSFCVRNSSDGAIVGY